MQLRGPYMYYSYLKQMWWFRMYMFCFFRFCTFFSRPTVCSSVSVALRLLFFSPAARHAHVSNLISFCFPGPPDRSKIVIFDRRSTSARNRQGLPCVLLCYAHNLPRSHSVCWCVHPFLWNSTILLRLKLQVEAIIVMETKLRKPLGVPYH
jgi:hypothetical protein